MRSPGRVVRMAAASVSLPRGTLSHALRHSAAASALRERSGAVVDNGCVDVSDCRRVLESGTGELFFHSLAHIDETTTLRAVACVCRAWSQLLDRSRSAEAAALWRSAWLTVPRGKLTLAAAIRTTRPGDRQCRGDGHAIMAALAAPPAARRAADAAGKANRSSCAAHVHASLTHVAARVDDVCRQRLATRGAG